MTRAHWYSFAIATVALLALVLYLSPHHGINRSNFDRIQDGMTLAEVEDIIGLSPGDYSTPSTGIVADTGLGENPPIIPGLTGRMWKGDWFTIGVEFDQARRVAGKTCSWKVEGERGFDLIPEGVREWLGL